MELKKGGFSAALFVPVRAKRAVAAAGPERRHCQRIELV
jgi:hypothetical protein